MKHTKITQTERELLSQWKQEGLSNKDCAKRLNRHVSTIGRELTRNKTRVQIGKKDWDNIYEPMHGTACCHAKKAESLGCKTAIKEQETLLVCH